MFYDVAKNYDESNQQNGCVKPEQEALAHALLSFWEEISETATEGNESLGELTDALRKISANQTFKPDTNPAFDKLLRDVGELDVSRKSSDSFNQALAEASSLIHWYPNNVYEDASSAVNLGNYCANLVGKKRDTQSNPFLFHSDEILVGLFLLSPNRLYPEHDHPALEMWVVLSGTAQWKRGLEPWQTRKPGEYFIHTQNQSHAMKTMDEPLFALWAWTGDLEQWAQWVHNEDEDHA